MTFRVQVRLPGKPYKTVAEDDDIIHVRWVAEQWLTPYGNESVRVVAEDGTVLVRWARRRITP